MRVLSRRYGLSDVGLAKVCERHKIPRPPRGYWAKKAAGRNPKQVPLPTVTDVRLDRVVLARQPSRPRTPPPPPAAGDVPAGAASASPPQFIDPLIGETLSRFLAAGEHVQVPSVLRSPLPAVSSTLDGLEHAARRQSPPVSGPRPTRFAAEPADRRSCVRVYLRRSNFRRGARFLDTVLKALISCGFDLTWAHDGAEKRSMLEGFGARLLPSLGQVTERVRHAPTAEGIAAYAARGARIPKFKDVLTDRLEFELRPEHAQAPLGTWSDGTARRIEEMIPDIVRAVLEHVDHQRERWRQEREVQRRHAEEWRRKEEEKKRQAQEQARVSAFIEEVKRWELARSMRSYAKALERTVLERIGRIDKGSELDQWLDWAHAAADRTDPQTPYRRLPKGEGESQLVEGEAGGDETPT